MGKTLVIVFCIAVAIGVAVFALTSTQRAEQLAQLKVEHPFWDWEMIAQGKVAIGMSEAEVRTSWGNPGDVNRSVGSWGVHEQWVYAGRYAYLYFENGILTSWQN